ncbi:MAG: hypothetical protein Q4B50_01670 [Bacillota bacterium]|nr:hypothetical protein [Bacillota bacterium]
MAPDHIRNYLEKICTTFVHYESLRTTVEIEQEIELRNVDDFQDQLAVRPDYVKDAVLEKLNEIVEDKSWRSYRLFRADPANGQLQTVSLSDDMEQAREEFLANGICRGEIYYLCPVDDANKLKMDKAISLSGIRWKDDLYIQCYDNKRAEAALKEPRPVDKPGILDYILDWLSFLWGRRENVVLWENYSQVESVMNNTIRQEEGRRVHGRKTINKLHPASPERPFDLEEWLEEHTVRGSGARQFVEENEAAQEGIPYYKSPMMLEGERSLHMQISQLKGLDDYISSTSPYSESVLNNQKFFPRAQAGSRFEELPPQIALHIVLKAGNYNKTEAENHKHAAYSAAEDVSGNLSSYFLSFAMTKNSFTDSTSGVEAYKIAVEKAFLNNPADYSDERDLLEKGVTYLEAILQKGEIGDARLHIVSWALENLEKLSQDGRSKELLGGFSYTRPDWVKAICSIHNSMNNSRYEKNRGIYNISEDKDFFEENCKSVVYRVAEGQLTKKFIDQVNEYRGEGRIDFLNKNSRAFDLLREELRVHVSNNEEIYNKNEKNLKEALNGGALKTFEKKFRTKSESKDRQSKFVRKSIILNTRHMEGKKEDHFQLDSNSVRSGSMSGAKIKRMNSKKSNASKRKTNRKIKGKSSFAPQMRPKNVKPQRTLSSDSDSISLEISRSLK